MNSEIRLKTEILCRKYVANEISLRDFQFEIEPLLGSFSSVSDDDTETIRRIVNLLEVIIYTSPEHSQKAEVQPLIREIKRYVLKKCD